MDYTSGGAPIGLMEAECEDDPELKAMFDSWKEIDPEKRLQTNVECPGNPA